VSNGLPFVVGNGVAGADLVLASGSAAGAMTHQFADGLLITNNATLSGVGTIVGNTTIAGTVSPGFSLGTLGLTGNLTLTGTAAMETRKSAGVTNDAINVTGAANYGGTLSVTADNTVASGDVFQLFNVTGAKNGNFASVEILPADLGLTGTFNPATGQLTLGGGSVTPPALDYVRNGNTIAFTWTGGFVLQYQTNAAGAGLSTNWVDYPDPSNPVIVTNHPSVPTTFFRLRQ
jgi:hypothetical protein